MKLRWPRGRYNGKRIVGFELEVKVNVLGVGFHGGWGFGMPYLCAGIIRISVHPAYEFSDWTFRRITDDERRTVRRAPTFG